MSDYIDRLFTFGQAHTTEYFLHAGGRLRDYWVTVRLPKGSDLNHAAHFEELFTSNYCPKRRQYAREYALEDLYPQFFPKGQLCVVKENGIYPPDAPVARFRYIDPETGNEIGWSTLDGPAVTATHPENVGVQMPDRFKDLLYQPLAVGGIVVLPTGSYLERVR
jgi:hypothetical protein